MFFRNTLRRPFLLRYFETGSWDVLQAGLNLMCYPFHFLQLSLRHQCIFTSPPQMRKIGVFSNKHSSKVNNCSHTYVIRQKARKATLNWQRHRVRPFRGAVWLPHAHASFAPAGLACKLMRHGRTQAFLMLSHLEVGSAASKPHGEKYLCSRVTCHSNIRTLSIKDRCWRAPWDYFRLLVLGLLKASIGHSEMQTLTTLQRSTI